MLDWHNSHAVLCRLDSWYFACIQHDPKSRNPLERQFSCTTTQNTNVLTLKVTLEYWTVDCAALLALRNLRHKHEFYTRRTSADYSTLLHIKVVCRVQVF